MYPRFCVVFAVLLVLVTIETTKSAKILVILPIPFVEHQLVYKPLIENLHKHQHQITVMTTNPGFREHEGRVYENITEIDLSFVYHLDFLNELKNVDLEGSDMIKTVFNVMRKIYEAELKSPKVKELLQSTEQFFDVVIVDWSGSSSVMNIFAHHFNAPLIAITHGEAFPNVHEAFGNPNHPVTFPAVFLPFSENLNLFQRVSSVLSTIWYR
jgi:glucuronosyltransferase